jgi:hypothetical protein
VKRLILSPRQHTVKVVQPAAASARADGQTWRPHPSGGPTGG